VGIAPIWELLKIDAEPNYMISFNGALSSNLASNTTLLSKGITGKDAKQIKQEIDAIGLDLHAFSTVHGVITPRHNPQTAHEAKVNRVQVTEFDFENLEDDHPIIKVLMVSEPERLTDGIGKLPGYLSERYTLVQSAPIFFEFLNPEVNKGVALRAIADDKGITMDEVLSFGDAGNDRAMLEMSGVGVAMGNADADTKSIADRVTASHEEDGIALIVEELVLS
jgi:Cof subfamily protein (haloacid dehalogenase superfamily)